MTTEPDAAQLFQAAPLELTEADVDVIVAKMREGRAAGYFRVAAHKALKAGRTPRPRKDQANG